ncbi:CBS domain-containing protein [Chondromyces crocatus]|uniref:Signal transduction protein n=1 Tax=Chondromyces crocatus TaxID=52 RepID=A0A0K1EKS5_CHOCO|nr:CBS domain-containing protein [Chondromyces crocatus]AKT41208.1 signal transduction protein [Chondromyces crocatus]
MVTVGEFCNRRVVTIGKTDKVLEAARRMRAHHVGSLVVVDEVDGLKPIGIVTDRDIVVEVVALASAYLESIQVGDLVTEPLTTARENESLLDTIRRMRHAGIRRIPVVNEEGAILGIIAFDDLLGFLSDELSELSALVIREQNIEAHRRL